MELSSLSSAAALEAILFVAEAPVPLSELAEVLELPRERVTELLNELEASLQGRAAGLVLREVGGGWRLYSHPAAYPYLERFTSAGGGRRLSAAALETLAVIAYRQPVSRSQLAEIRGVDPESAVATLERLGLVEEAARLTLPGNPAVYRTTPLFLEKMGINDMGDLPELADHVPPASVVDVLEETFRQT